MKTISEKHILRSKKQILFVTLLLSFKRRIIMSRKNSLFCILSIRIINKHIVIQYVENIGTITVTLRKENDVPVRAVSASFALSGA